MIIPPEAPNPNSISPTTDVGHVRLPLNQRLSAPKVTQFKLMILRVQQ